MQLSVDFPSSPTDHAIIAVYTTLDGASEVWDLIPMMEFLIENTTDPNRISFLPALMGSAPPATPPSTGTGVVTFLMG